MTVPRPSDNLNEDRRRPPGPAYGLVYFAPQHDPALIIIKIRRGNGSSKQPVALACIELFRFDLHRDVRREVILLQRDLPVRREFIFVICNAFDLII